jgi:glycosyltransferase involved in cell wall biosynthesis
LRVVISQPCLPKYRVPVFRALNARPGLAVRVVHGECLDFPPSVPADGFTGERVLSRRVEIGDRAILWHAPQWTEATRRQADVIVLGWDLNYASLVPALLRARRERVGTVLWGHGFSVRESAWRDRARLAVGGLADALLLYAEPAAARLRSRPGWAERVFVAPNSLDQCPIQAARAAWIADPARLAAFRRQHGLEPGPVVLFVSRLSPEKHVDRLLRATARLRAEHPHLRLLIVGAGVGEPELRALARALDLGESARFLGAIYDEAELAPWFLCADAFAFPGTIGLSILHAFGYGLPVVTHARRAEHHPEIASLVDGENGVLFDPPDSLEALARALGVVLSDPDRRRSMGQAAHRTATELFTMERMVDGMERAIRFAAAARTRAAQSSSGPRVSRR